MYTEVGSITLPIMDDPAPMASIWYTEVAGSGGGTSDNNTS